MEDIFKVTADEGLVEVLIEDHRKDALDYFEKLAASENAALCLWQNGEMIASSNGYQCTPHGEITYYVTKSELRGWLFALEGR